MGAKTAGTWVSTDQKMGVGDLTVVGTTLLHPLGTRIKAEDKGTTAYGIGEFIYLEGVANTVRGDLAYITADFATVLVVARSIGDLAVALAANNAAASYGWYQIFGKGVVRSDSSITDDAPLYIDGTAGRCDDTVVAGDAIQGMRAASTDDTNTIVAYMNYPKVGDFDNA